MKPYLSNCSTYTIALGFSLLASPALAHSGHIETAGNGHSHFLALGAVCVAIIVGGLGVLHSIKMRKLKAVD